MLEASLRPTFDRLLVLPIAAIMVKLKLLSANTITLFAVIFGVLVMPALLFHYNAMAVILLLLSGYCDVLDGSLARYSQTTSARGAMYDICSDRIVEVSVILGLYSYAPQQRAWLCLLMLASVLLCVTSFLVAAALHASSGKKAFYYSPGLMERAEAFIFFVLMIALPALFVPLALLFVALVFYTFVARVMQH